MHKRLKDLPENVKINVSGNIIETKLKVLRKFDRSILADIFSGRRFTSVDEKGNAIIDSDPEVFQNMLKYIEEDRTWLPPMDQLAKRELAETEIRKWQVDCGLAKPSTLLTKAAIDFQTVLDTEPDVSLCDTKDALQAWQKLGPMKLSQIALQSQKPLDIDDDRHVCVSVDNDIGAKVVMIRNNDDTIPEVCLGRSIYREGTIEEGQTSSSAGAFRRTIFENGLVQMGSSVKGAKNGPQMTIFPDGERICSEYVNDKRVKELPNFEFELQ